MEYDVFKNQFEEALKRNMVQDGVELIRSESTKNNGVVKDGLTAKYPESLVSPQIYIDDFYEMYQRGYSISEVADIASDTINKHKSALPEPPVLTQESARENLYCVLINTAAIEEMLKNMPHEKLEDLSIIPRFKVGDIGSFRVTNEICEMLKMTSEEVMEVAHTNTERMNFKCQPYAETLREMLSTHMPPDYVEELIQEQEEHCPMWILTNDSKLDGAVAITSQKTLEDAHEKLDGDYYILPSSKHEVILIPQKVVTDVDELRDLVRHVNETEVRSVDRLSDNVYFYDGRRLSLAEGKSNTINLSISDGLEKSIQEVIEEGFKMKEKYDISRLKEYYKTYIRSNQYKEHFDYDVSPTKMFRVIMIINPGSNSTEVHVS